MYAFSNLSVGLKVLTVTAPDGSVSEYVLTNDSAKFYYVFKTPTPGRYDVHVDYSYSNKQFATDTVVNVSYSTEYDRFAVFSDTVLYKALRNRGEVVSSDVIPEYSYEDRELTTYVVRFTVPFMIAAAALYVVDVIIRKLKLREQL